MISPPKGCVTPKDISKQKTDTSMHRFFYHFGKEA